MNRIIRYVLILLMLCSLTGCRSVSLSQLSAENTADKLFVGVTPELEPICFSRDGKIQGIEVDFARALAMELGQELRLVELPWSQQIEALESGSTDIIMSGMTVAGPREMRVQFCTPYLTISQLAIIRTADSMRFQSRESVMLATSKAGVKEGSTAQYLARQVFRGAEINLFKTTDKALDALEAGKIDMVLTDAPVAWQLLARRNSNTIRVLPWTMSPPQSLAWAVLRGNAQLLQQVNRTHARWSENGVLTQTIFRWMPYAAP